VHEAVVQSGRGPADLARLPGRARRADRRYRGLALALLVAGDRQHHVAAEIRRRKLAGQIVICDRYVPSSLVLQRMDELGWDTIWQLNATADRPDLAVIFNAAPQVIAARLASRGGPHSRFERTPGSSQIESDLYRDTAARLAAAGWPVHPIDCTGDTAAHIAAILTDRILRLHSTRSAHERQRPDPADLQHR
jgi:dTMP kinase